MPTNSASPVVVIIAEKPKTIRAMAKIVRRELPQADVKTIFSVFTSVGKESMEGAAANLARFSPDIVICVVEYRKRDSDLITTILQRITRKPITVYTRVCAKPGGWTVETKGSTSSDTDQDPFLERLRRAA